jgi:hypothetical protein
VTSEARASIFVTDLPIARRVGSVRSTGLGLAIEHLGCECALPTMADSDVATRAMVITRHRPGKDLRRG